MPVSTNQISRKTKTPYRGPELIKIVMRVMLPAPLCHKQSPDVLSASVMTAFQKAQNSNKIAF
jgi:hypothetical protein